MSTARKTVSQMINDLVETLPHADASRDQMRERLSAIEAAARRDENDACAREACILCADGIPLLEAMPGFHASDGRPRLCFSTQIRARIEPEHNIYSLSSSKQGASSLRVSDAGRTNVCVG